MFNWVSRLLHCPLNSPLVGTLKPFLAVQFSLGLEGQGSGSQHR